jgi:hypothetical protein
VFTLEQRNALRARMLQLAEEDERVVAGAAVGSLAVGSGDRFSDLDLTFGIADGVPVAHVLDDWTSTLTEELDAVRLTGLTAGPTIYRVFLLPDALQFDLSMTSATEFRPAGPRFQLLFGETAADESEARGRRGAFSFPRPRPQGTSSGGASSMRYTRGRASSVAASGRRNITSAQCAITPSRLRASIAGDRRCRRVGTTSFRLRLSRASTAHTSGRSSPTHYAVHSPPLPIALLNEGVEADLPDVAVVAERLAELHCRRQFVEDLEVSS